MPTAAVHSIAARAWSSGQPTASSEARRRGASPARREKSASAAARAPHVRGWRGRAGRFLAGLCGSGRAFMKRGRPQMTPTVYEDSVRLKARRLVTQMDSLIAYTPTCEQRAGATPDSTATEVGKRMKSYDAALRDF